MAQLGRVTYRPNHRSMARFLLSPQLKRVVEAAAKDIAGDAAEAERRRPKRSGRSTGTLANSYVTGTLVSDAFGAEGGPRVAGAVGNTQDYAPAIELGTENTPGEHILERAASAYHVPRAARRALGGGRG